MPQLNHLFSPIKLGSMELPNRLVMPPMSINFGVGEDGYVTEQKTAYLAKRAKNGPGMITIGGGAVHPSGLDLPRMPPIWADRYIPSLKTMVDELHKYPAKIGMQLLHGGRQAFHAERVAPSPLPSLGVVKGVPRELTHEEVLELISAHGDAARRCQEAGLDFVEIHAAHGYLIGEFLSPLSNCREDDWGGSFANRTRFLLEIITDIKMKCGTDYPVGVRINGDDCIDGGWTLADCVRLAPTLEQQGADWLHISAGIYGSHPVTIPPMYSEAACFVHLAEAIKAAVNIPVIAVGRIKNVRLADQLIAEGKADLVAMGRAHLADPELAAKARAGRWDEIRPCIGCCLGCIDQALSLNEATCVMNPEVNREYLLGDLEPVARPLNILVVGAGPAGMAAARLAALRGHRVTVIDEANRVGGLLASARLAPGRGELGDMVDFYHRELIRLGVDTRLSTELSRELIAELKPAKAVIASGSRTEPPQIEGLYDVDMDLHMVTDVLDGEELAGNRAVVLGGGAAALSTADFIAGRCAEVVVLNRDGHFAEELSANDRSSMRESLKKPNIRLYKQVAIQGFPAGGGVMFSAGDRRFELTGMTDLIIAEGRRSVRNPADLFRGTETELYIIGDAKGPRSLLESQSEADEVGRSL